MYLHLSVILFTGGKSLSRGVSVGGGGCPGDLYSGGLCHGDPPPRMVEERALRILLECILVLELFDNQILCILLTSSGLHV